jgi:hypothetical protein
VVHVEVEQQPMMLCAGAVERQEPVDIDCPHEDRSTRRKSIWNVGSRRDTIDDTPRGTATRKPLKQAC